MDKQYFVQIWGECNRAGVKSVLFGGCPGSLGRIPDIKTTDGTLIEAKGWKDRYLALERLVGKLDDEGGRIAGRMSKQAFNDTVKKALDPSDRRVWMFADEGLEALKPEFAQEIVNKISNDSIIKMDFMNILNVGSKKEFDNEYIESGKLENIVNDLMRETL